MAAALKLVVGIALKTVVAIADGLADRKSLAQEALVDEMSAYLILKADHTFKGVCNAALRPAALWPGADQ